MAYQGAAVDEQDTPKEVQKTSCEGRVWDVWKPGPPPSTEPLCKCERAGSDQFGDVFAYFLPNSSIAIQLGRGIVLASGFEERSCEAVEKV